MMMQMMQNSGMSACGHSTGMGYGSSNVDRWRFPPWIAFANRGRAGALHQHRNGRHPPYARRTVQRTHTINTDFKICDCPIVCYFSLAISMMLIGILITIFVLEDAFGQFNSMIGQLWLAGPLLASCGLVIFVRTVIFVRRKQALRRQREELRRRRRNLRASRTLSGNRLDLDAPCSRRDSFSSLPPDYEAVINGVSLSTGRCGHIMRRLYVPRPSLAFLNLEEPPPSYEEVIRAEIITETNCPLYADLHQCFPESVQAVHSGSRRQSEITFRRDSKELPDTMVDFRSA